jgi:hypothetical protein
LADSDPGHREARAGRVRRHDKLLRQVEDKDIRMPCDVGQPESLIRNVIHDELVTASVISDRDFVTVIQYHARVDKLNLNCGCPIDTR